jgi:O-antigen/teichoic acid export membrane protein
MIVPPEPRGRRRAARGLPASAMLRRLSWGVADQAVSSLTNVVVGLYVARTLGPVDFGAFSLAYVTYAFLLNASRGVATDPLVVRHSGSPDASWRTAASRSAGTATVVGVVGGAACLFAAVLFGTDGATGAAFLALGVTVPGLLLQDAWRFVFFSCGRGGQALLNDAVWGTTLLVCLTLVTAGGQADVLSVTLIWGFTGTVAALFGAVQVRSLPRPSQCLRWVLDNRDLAPRYLAENLSMSGAAQLRMYGVGALAGLTAVGAVRGAEVLMGPFFVLLYGLSAVAVPEAVRVRKRASQDLLRFCLSLGALMAAAAACWGAVLLLLMPLGPGGWLLGDVWPLSSALLVPATLAVVNASFSVGASAGLRALAAARRSLRAQLVGAAAYFVGGITGAALGGAVGSAWGIAAATFVGAVVWWWHFRRGIAEGFVTSRHEGSINPTISSGRTS